MKILLFFGKNQYHAIIEFYESLGVEIVENLSWVKHIDKIWKKVSAGFGAIKRAKPYVNTNELHTIYKALV